MISAIVGLSGFAEGPGGDAVLVQPTAVRTVKRAEASQTRGGA
jgi:hypothetical protein